MGGGIQVNIIEDRVHFMFQGTNLCLDLDGNNEIENGSVQAWKQNDSAAQKWLIKKVNNKDTFYILIGNNSALTYNESDDKICIKEFTYADNQKWVIK